MTVGTKSIILEDISPTGIASPAFTLRVIRNRENFALSLEASEGSWSIERGQETGGFSLHNGKSSKELFVSHHSGLKFTIESFQPPRSKTSKNCLV